MSLFLTPYSDKVFSERTNHLFVCYRQRKTWGTGAPAEMSDGCKCFQQLLLQWVEHVQSIPKQIKSSGQSEWDGVWGKGKRGGGAEPAATELDGERKRHAWAAGLELKHGEVAVILKPKYQLDVLLPFLMQDLIIRIALRARQKSLSPI